MEEKIKKMLDVIFDGLPPTLNHWHGMSHGRIYKTEQAREWQEEITALLIEAWNDKEPYTGRVKLEIIFYVKSKRKWDLDNRIKALQDCLEYAGVIANDNQIDMLIIMRVSGNKDSTRIKLSRHGEGKYNDG